MLFGSHAVIRSPKDISTRTPAQYGSGLTPEIMGQVFDRSDRGEIGPLCELGGEIWGKDTFVGGLIGDRLAACSEAQLLVMPNERDPDQTRAFELCAFVESWIHDLRLYKCRSKVKLPRSEGGLPAVLEAFSIPWFFGVGYYWRLWDTVPGMPRPLPVGIEFLDPCRYRTASSGDVEPETGFYLETEGERLGTDMYSYPEKMWSIATASRAGQRIALSGVIRGIVFWWWMRISGSFAVSRILDKFGVPNVIGEASTPAAGSWTQEEQTRLDQFLQSYHSDVAACFPAGYKPVLVQMGPGADAIAQVAINLSRSAIMYGILGNEVSTSAQGAAASVGVAGGSGTAAERVEKRLSLQDRRRAVDQLTDLELHAIIDYYGAANARFLPTLSLIDGGQQQNTGTR